MIGWLLTQECFLYNELIVQLGYPGLVEGQVIPDKRNDKRILDIFANDDKLIK